MSVLCPIGYRTVEGAITNLRGKTRGAILPTRLICTFVLFFEPHTVLVLAVK